MDDDLRAARRHVLRRVRYATNTLALLETRLPPEGPFDDALTNGLVCIVSNEWPGEEGAPRHLRPARDLLHLIRDKADPSLSFIRVDSLLEALDLTQPFRHGRADDEFATITPMHIEALRALDRHWSLDLLDKARGQSVNDVLMIAYEEQAETHLPFDPKDRLDTPSPEECPDCWRPTFLPVGWDEWGGNITSGVCIACGYERSEEAAYDAAMTEALRRHMEVD